MVKRIGLVGTHSSGKDTLSYYICNYLKKKDKSVHYIDEQAIVAILRNFPLNRPAGQLWYMGKQIQEETEYINKPIREYIVCNRTVIDPIAYTADMMHTGDCQGMMYVSDMVKTLENIALSYMRAEPYSLILLLRPFSKLHDDGVRMTDREQQLRIDKKMVELVYTYCKKLDMDFVEIKADSYEEREKEVELAIDLWHEKWNISKR